jgi:hypothetical protein
MRTLLLLPLLLLVACASDPSAPLPPAGTGAPFSGIRVTSPDGPRQIMEWGTPLTPNIEDVPGGGGGPGIPVQHSTDFTVTNPFPNPASSTVTFSFPLGLQSEVRIWVEQIEPAGTFGGHSSNRIGSVVSTPRTRFVKSILDDATILEPGQHSVEFALADSNAAMPPGFYRIFIATPGGSAWRDIIVYRSLADLPGSLRDVVSGW